MPDRIDARVPVRFATSLDAPVPAEALVLVEEGLGVPSVAGGTSLRPARFAPAHDGRTPADDPSCSCCNGRAPFATALGALFAERAKGTAPFFREVLAVGTARGLAHARAALAADPFLLGRYRLAGPERPPASPV